MAVAGLEHMQGPLPQGRRGVVCLWETCCWQNRGPDVQGWPSPWGTLCLSNLNRGYHWKAPQRSAVTRLYPLEIFQAGREEAASHSLSGMRRDCKATER